MILVKSKLRIGRVFFSHPPESMVFSGLSSSGICAHAGFYSGSHCICIMACLLSSLGFNVE